MKNRKQKGRNPQNPTIIQQQLQKYKSGRLCIFKSTEVDEQLLRHNQNISLGDLPYHHYQLHLLNRMKHGRGGGFYRIHPWVCQSYTILLVIPPCPLPYNHFLNDPIKHRQELKFHSDNHKTNMTNLTNQPKLT